MFKIIKNKDVVNFRKLSLHNEGLNPNLVYLYILGKQRKMEVFYDCKSFYAKPNDFYFLIDLLEKSVELN